jgi:hypothetical protein
LHFRASSQPNTGRGLAFLWLTQRRSWHYKYHQRTGCEGVFARKSVPDTLLAVTGHHSIPASFIPRTTELPVFAMDRFIAPATSFPHHSQWKFGTFITTCSLIIITNKTLKIAGLIGVRYGWWACLRAIMWRPINVAREVAIKALLNVVWKTVLTITALVVLTTVETTVDVTWIQVGGLSFWTNSWTCCWTGIWIIEFGEEAILTNPTPLGIVTSSSPGHYLSP